MKVLMTMTMMMMAMLVMMRRTMALVMKDDATYVTCLRFFPTRNPDKPPGKFEAILLPTVDY